MATKFSRPMVYRKCNEKAKETRSSLFSIIMFRQNGSFPLNYFMFVELNSSV